VSFSRMRLWAIENLHGYHKSLVLRGSTESIQKSEKFIGSGQADKRNGVSTVSRGLREKGEVK